MPLLPPWCDLLLFPGVIVCLLGVGIFPARRLGWRGPEAVLVAFGLGAGLTALFVLLLGALGLYYPVTFWMLLLAGLGLFAINARRFPWADFARALKPANNAEWLLAAFTALILAYQFLGCLMPATGQDEITYHLNAPRQFLLAHRVEPTPLVIQANFPFNAQMLYLFGLGIGGDILCKLLHWSLWLGSATALVLAGRRVAPGSGWLAAFLIVAVPAAAYARAPLAAGSDLPTAFFAAMGLLALLSAPRRPSRQMVLTTALFAGFALGTKYTALVFIFPVLFLLLFFQLRGSGQPLSRTARKLSLFVVIAVAVFSPWMIKNALFTGNPVYPMMGEYVPSPYPYNAAAEAVMRYEENKNFYRDGGNPFVAAVAFYVGEKVRWALHEGDVLLVPFFLLSIVGLFSGRGTLRWLAMAGLFCNVIFLFLYGDHLDRLFTVTYPLAALLSAATLHWLVPTGSRQRIILVLLGVFLFQNTVSQQYRWLQIIPEPPAISITWESKAAYLDRRFPEPGLERIRGALLEHTPPDSLIASVGLEPQFHVHRRMLAAGYFEPNLVEVIERNHNDSQAVWRELTRRGVTHLFIKTAKWPSALGRPWLNQYADRLWKHADLEIYRLRPAASQSPDSNTS